MTALWQQQMKEAFRDSAALGQFLGTPLPKLSHYPLFVPRPLAERIRSAGPDSALWKQFVPTSEEEQGEEGLRDPIGDEEHLKFGQLIHRYQNRALFLPTPYCPVACRYCFRKNELGQSEAMFRPQFDQVVAYLQSHPEINEIIFTGGDPLILSDKKLSHFAHAFAQTPVRYLRLHTRTPTVLPSRVTPALTAQLKTWQSNLQGVVIVLHTNHPDELDAPVRQAIKDLAHSGAKLFAQSVLLKGVNDHPQTLASLFENLSTLGVVPHYLHHPDRAQGAMHFWLPTKTGRQIYQQTRNLLPGWMLPKYVIDLPEGRGKTPLSPTGQLLDRHGHPAPNLPPLAGEAAR